ncbi:glycosyltransferase family 2 protein [Pseudoalteromonas aurantia]|nr:glycosyltransferase family A protein [Pseudoalteromonas aurantia]TMO67080.1 glycosyltransferase family 2 protein [Pseudoalteromonas aurantia]
MSEAISIIIPTYRRAEQLLSAIDSVRKQTFKNWKVIVVDDNHDDEFRASTAQIMAQYESDSQIDYIQHITNQGACKARNTGWQYAQGQYIAFLDDDDVWDETKLEKQVQALELHNAAFCYTNMYLSYQGRIKEFKCLSDKEIYKGLLKQGFGVCTSALLFTREAIEKVNGFDDSLPSMQDYDLLLRVAKCHAGILLEEPLLTYQLADDGISCNPKSKALGHRGIIEKHKSAFLSLKLFDGLSRQYESLADFELRRGNRLISVRIYTKALQYKKFNMRVYVKCLLGLLLGKWPLETFLQARQRKTSSSLNNTVE